MPPGRCGVGRAANCWFAGTVIRHLTYPGRPDVAGRGPTSGCVRRHHFRLAFSIGRRPGRRRKPYGRASPGPRSTRATGTPDTGTPDTGTPDTGQGPAGHGRHHRHPEVTPDETG